MLAKRLQDEGEDWRHVYKSLLLLEYMCKHGPQKVQPQGPCMRMDPPSCLQWRVLVAGQHGCLPACRQVANGSPANMAWGVAHNT